jgi:hypothetical protein
MNEDGYKVISVEDDVEALQAALDKISDDSGVVVSVVWQPARRVKVGGTESQRESGYVVVADFGLEEPPLQ